MEDNRKFLQETINIKSVSDNYFIENYHITNCNKLAVEATLSKPLGFDPFANILIIKGQKSSGKTFLASVCKQRKNGIIIKTSSELNTENFSLYLIDDADKWQENELFHAINLAHENKRNLIIFACQNWNANLPDLRSRMLSIKTEIINQPDDELIEVIIVSEFSKRSLEASKEVVAYLKTRLERNFKAILSAIERIDQYCLKHKRNITIRAISEAL